MAKHVFLSLKISKETSKTELKKKSRIQNTQKCGTVTKGVTTHVRRTLGTKRRQEGKKKSQVIMAEISPN